MLWKTALLALVGLTAVSAQREPFVDPFADLLDVIPPFSNFANLTITWPSGLVLAGTVNSSTEFTPSGTSGTPTSFQITPIEGGSANPLLPITPSQLFTLVMIDPDAPSRQNPTLKEILHALWTGLKPSAESNGETVSLTGGTASVSYVGPGPPQGSGLHRYIFLLFRQTNANINLGGASANNRIMFNVRNFANTNTLGSPVAVAYFVAQNANNPGAPKPVNGDVGNDGGLIVDTSAPPVRTPGTRTSMLDSITYNGTLTVPPLTGPTVTGRPNATRSRNGTVATSSFTLPPLTETNLVNGTAPSTSAPIIPISSNDLSGLDPQNQDRDNLAPTTWGGGKGGDLIRRVVASLVVGILGGGGVFFFL